MLNFEQTSLVEPAMLVTIVTEAVLKDSLITLLKNLKVKGYTVTTVQGESRYPRLVETTSEVTPSDTSGDTQTETKVEISVETTLEIRAIVSSETSNVILYALKEQQHQFAVLAYRQPIEMLSEY
jgi:nitrogen regulatory protein PII